MAELNSTPPPKETPAIRRDRRDTMMVEHFDSLTLQLRALATELTPIEQARRIARRYARSVGVQASVVTDELVEFLQRPEVAGLRIDQIDDVFLTLDEPGADLVALARASGDAAGAIARASAASR